MLSCMNNLKQHFVADKPSNGGVDDQEVQLSKDEMNAVHYVSGYVPMKLLKKYETKERSLGRRQNS